ncbi:Dimer-Tnp-hAT domain-containing protein [Mycena venus]|uniref:Dimer-Tnp-hAT domain-containing protein n=1 Tax=Mycena venus TaxID=2733690 RepID=A0A8H6XYD8_9AGAR|nr:Dimer-Tnp-hAT domain-containing protein [Mycena venus]
MPSSKSSSGSSIRSITSVAACKLKGAAKQVAKTAVSAVKAVVLAKSQSSRKNDDGDNNDTKSRMRSGVYQFFEQPKLDTDEHGQEYQFFKCAAPQGCKYTAKGKAADRSSTSNLLKHAKKCWGADIVEARMKGVEAQGRDGDIFAAFARASDRPYPAERPAHIVRWVTENHRPLSLIEDHEFRLILVSRDLNAAYGRARAYVEALLTGYNGRLSFSTDAWTSPNHCAFVAWIIHLQHEGQLLAFPLDIYEVPESHTGESLAREFDDMLSRFNIGHKFLAWTGDNATSNDTQNTALGDSPNNSFKAVNRVHCFAHTLNLAVQAFLRPFSPPKKKKGGKGKDGDDTDDDNDDNSSDSGSDINDFDLEDDEDLPDLADISTDSLDNVDDVNDSAWEAMDEVERVMLLEETDSVKQVITRIRKLAFSIIHSTTKGLPAWRKACTNHEMHVRLIPRDVFTYKEVINDFTGDCDLGYRKYDLSNVQWTLVEDMLHVLKVFKDATLYFSNEKHCTITQVLTTLDKIDDVITATVVTSSVQPGGVPKLLHPNYKLNYFRARKWEKAWIDTATDLVCEEFDAHYASAADNDDGDGADAASDVVSMSSSQVEFDDATNWLEDIPLPNVSHVADELEEYLAQPTERTRVNLLCWWWEKCHVWPRLSRMALDYLCIPATSTPVE